MEIRKKLNVRPSEERRDGRKREERKEDGERMGYKKRQKKRNRVGRKKNPGTEGCEGRIDSRKTKGQR